MTERPPPKVVFLSGPFRAKTPWLIERNVRHAEELSLDVWRAGAACLCPHTMTRHFQDSLPDEVWLQGVLELLRRCDAVLLSPLWAISEGARGEREEAVRLGLPVFDTVAELKAWLDHEGGGR